MPNIESYLEWRGDIPFSVDPFNEVDNLVLAELAYTEFGDLIPEGSRVPLRRVQKEFFETHSREEIRRSRNPIRRAPLLMDTMITGQRFGEIRLMDYVDILDTESDVQMSAVTYLLDDETAYVAFRGTDNTLVGWKEDFNMSYLPETGGQRKAIEYLDLAAAHLRRPLRVGGHSKGGNFAVYASAFARKSVQDRIINVYTNDGPGFRDEVMQTDEYKAILPKVISIVPETCIIGMLLASSVNHIIVESNDQGLMQHDGQTWQVRRNRFVRTEMSDLGNFIRKAQKDWLSKLDDDRREFFVDTLFSLLEASGVDTFGEMVSRKNKTAERILSVIQDIPRENQKEFMKIIGELIQSSGQTAVSSLGEWIRSQMDNNGR